MSELAGRINVRKADNTIEAAAPRGERKQIAAEEPVNARIRRRQEEAAEVQRKRIHPQAMPSRATSRR